MAGINGMLCLVIAAVLAEAIATDYCNNSKLCKGGQIHTMCKFKPAPAQKCGQCMTTGLTPDQRNSILKQHNEIRRNVAAGKVPGCPPAAYMPDLIWDTELEQVAQRWAYQCKLGHDDCRNVDAGYVGQNVAMAMSTANNLYAEKMPPQWFKEVDIFNRGEIPRFSGNNMDAGHYTQVIWADTTKVGCGFIKCLANGWYETYLVCNYNPGGNILGMPIYKIKN